jgi:hypothetical protein
MGEMTNGDGVIAVIYSIASFDRMLTALVQPPKATWRADLQYSVVGLCRRPELLF